jgi:hypothetical protein
MTLEKFIRDNKQELSRCILQACDGAPTNSHGNVTNKECRLWIMNDEGLYRWARSEGVDI